MAKYRTLKGTTPSTNRKPKPKPKRYGYKRTTITVGPDGKTSFGATKVGTASPITAKEFNVPAKSYSKRSRKYGVPGGRIGPPKPKK